MGRYDFLPPHVSLLDVAMGKVPGYTHLNKFGANPEIETGTDPEDVWAGGGLYSFYPTSAETLEVLSSSTDDVATTGTGAWTIIVFGLDGDGVEVNEVVILNGQGIVALTEHDYIHVYRVIVLTAGTSSTNAGNITVRIASAGTTAAYIGAGNGQTLQCIYMVPADRSAFFIKGYVGISAGGLGASNEGATFRWKAKPFNGGNGAWATNGLMECTTRGSSHFQYEYGVPAGPLPEMTLIRIECSTVSATMGVVGGFDVIIVENRLL